MLRCLPPANLLPQWQGELREKGGLRMPRLEGLKKLVWPDGREETVPGLSEALERPLLLMSRETARTEGNLPILLGLLRKLQATGQARSIMILSATPMHPTQQWRAASDAANRVVTAGSREET